jgi:hypothetical protein
MHWMSHPRWSRHYRDVPSPKLLVSALAGLSLLAASSAATAQIKQPGAHPDYGVEIEPHVVLQWAREPLADEGLGLGARFTIPFLDNGPISKINNNMGIGFGFDWVRFEDPCWGWRGWRGPRDPFLYTDECSATVLHFPVVLQWNFFLTPMISVFGEPGFEIEHTSLSFDWYCNGPNGIICEQDFDETDVEFVFWGGARFMFSDTFGALVRVGTPYLSAGITLLL